MKSYFLEAKKQTIKMFNPYKDIKIMITKKNIGKPLDLEVCDYLRILSSIEKDEVLKELDYPLAISTINGVIRSRERVSERSYPVFVRLYKKAKLKHDERNRQTAEITS